MAYGTDMTQSLRGVFIPLWLIACPEVGHGAKLLYVLLAQKAGVKGVTRAFVPALATELGDDEAQIYRHLNELERCGLVELRRQGAEADILSCAFPAYEPSGRASARDSYSGKSEGRWHPNFRRLCPKSRLCTKSPTPVRKVRYSFLMMLRLRGFAGVRLLSSLLCFV